MALKVLLICTHKVIHISGHRKENDAAIHSYQPFPLTLTPVIQFHYSPFLS